jgi:integrase
MMASLSKRKSGAFDVQFICPSSSRRKTIGLGKVAKKSAETFKIRVERLVEAKVLGLSVDSETARWLRNLPDSMNAKLAEAGLTERRTSKTLGELLDALFAAKKPDLAPNTYRNYGQVRRNLLTYFGENRDIRQIDHGDAESFKANLIESGLSTATISRRIKRSREFFKWAMRRGWVESNPFEDVSAGSQENRARLEFVEEDTIRRVIDAAPDAGWRLLIALARFGGLRIPSEIRSLTWSDVLWDQGLLHVQSPKTKRHEGHEERFVPIFSRLRPYLEDAFEMAEEGEPLVFPWLPTDSGSFHTRMKRIIQRAGVKPWERLFSNLRASLATELADQFPAHVCEAWLGHSARVADRHYRQTRDLHIERATQDEVGALHEALQQTTEMECERAQIPKTENGPVAIRPIFQGIAANSEECQSSLAPPAGVEPVVGTSIPGKGLGQVGISSAARGAALNDEITDLAALLAELPDSDRAELLGSIRTLVRFYRAGDAVRTPFI